MWSVLKELRAGLLLVLCNSETNLLNAAEWLQPISNDKSTLLIQRSLYNYKLPALQRIIIPNPVPTPCRLTYLTPIPTTHPLIQSKCNFSAWYQCCCNKHGENCTVISGFISNQYTSTNQSLVTNNSQRAETSTRTVLHKLCIIPPLHCKQLVFQIFTSLHCIHHIQSVYGVPYITAVYIHITLHGQLYPLIAHLQLQTYKQTNTHTHTHTQTHRLNDHFSTKLQSFYICTAEHYWNELNSTYAVHPLETGTNFRFITDRMP